jgi:hypothetical protein
VGLDGGFILGVASVDGLADPFPLPAFRSALLAGPSETPFIAVPLSEKRALVRGTSALSFTPEASTSLELRDVSTRAGRYALVGSFQGSLEYESGSFAFDSGPGRAAFVAVGALASAGVSVPDATQLFTQPNPGGAVRLVGVEARSDAVSPSDVWNGGQTSDDLVEIPGSKRGVFSVVRCSGR